MGQGVWSGERAVGSSHPKDRRLYSTRGGRRVGREKDGNREVPHPFSLCPHTRQFGEPSLRDTLSKKTSKCIDTRGPGTHPVETLLSERSRPRSRSEINFKISI